jgi:hypothetical protein
VIPPETSGLAASPSTPSHPAPATASTREGDAVGTANDPGKGGVAALTFTLSDLWAGQALSAAILARSGLMSGPKDPKGCRFIIGELGGDWRFCQVPQAPGSSYCDHHHERCFTLRPRKGKGNGKT